jgi:two-component system phosphate regulon sensor histidine kinase PhoR
MRLSLHRFPRESKVAAVVLGAALVQVGVLAALGLRSTSERRQAIERELAENSVHVVRNAVIEATARVGEAEVRMAKALSPGDGRSPWVRVKDAMEGRVAPLFVDAYLIAPDGRVADFQRPPYPAPAAGLRDEEARRRLAEVQRLEVSDPARAVGAARALADEIFAKPQPDVVAASLALQSGWRAAYVRGEFENARALAKSLLDRGCRAVRDDRGSLAESEPFGPSASALVCKVLFASLVNATSQHAVFVDAVVDRRIQAQRLRPLLSDAAYRVEKLECDDLCSKASVLMEKERRPLATDLEKCDEVDRRETALQQALGKSTLRNAASGEFSSRFDLEGRSLVTVIPLPEPRAGEPIGAAFVAPPSALKTEALDPAARAPLLPDGVALAVRDGLHHDVLAKVDGPALLDPGVPFGSAVPGLTATVVLVDPSVLARETASAERLWIAILIGAACAVVAASLLAVRSVMREVRLARMKSDFVSNLSHELRTPLTSVRMFVETLREGRVRDEKEAKECLDIVAQETDRLQSLVERMLQFASFSRGRAPIELKSADAGDVARRAVALFRKRAEAAKATLELSVQEPLPESILDRDAVLQVLLNLLDNAVKYAGHDGAKIGVTVRAAGTAPTVAGRVVIEVEDDGPGVPEKEQHLVFEEFYRGDDTLSRRVEGTGIGLAVSRRIVLAHGGRIEVVRSERLGGACFRVTLPEAGVGRRLALEAAGGTES